MYSTQLLLDPVCRHTYASRASRRSSAQRSKVTRASLLKLLPSNTCRLWQYMPAVNISESARKAVLLHRSHQPCTLLQSVTNQAHQSATAWWLVAELQHRPAVQYSFDCLASAWCAAEAWPKTSGKRHLNIDAAHARAGFYMLMVRPTRVRSVHHMYIMLLGAPRSTRKLALWFVPMTRCTALRSHTRLNKQTHEHA